MIVMVLLCGMNIMEIILARASVMSKISPLVGERFRAIPMFGVGFRTYSCLFGEYNPGLSISVSACASFYLSRKNKTNGGWLLQAYWGKFAS